MSRPKSGSDFVVDVDGIGKFMFARRTMRDQFRIRGQYAELTGGNYDTDGNPIDVVGWAYATLQVLIVKEPEGFSLDGMDPNVDSLEDCEARILSIFGALRTKEGSFRRGVEEIGEATGQGPGS